MNIVRFSPSAPLRPFIKMYMVIETPYSQVNRILPDTSAVMAIRFKGMVKYVDGSESELPTSILSGLRKTNRQVNYFPGSGNVLVIFREGKAGTFVREPMHELFEASVSVDCLANFHDIHTLEERLSEAASNQDRIAQVDQFFLSRLEDNQTDKLVLSAIDQIRNTKGGVRIRSLANDHCISLDAFEKRFRRMVGVSPKQFSYLARMQYAVQGAMHKKSLTGVAMAAGYFDQAHFNKDFKRYTGQTPTEFLLSPSVW